jgi:hypothetical protein
MVIHSVADPTFWGFSATAWSAFTAIGTLGLAGTAFVTIWVGNRQRRADRQEFANRLLEERRERQDDDARQVSVTLFQPHPVMRACTISVSAPVGYQVSQLTVMFATDQGALIAVTDPTVQEEKDGRIWWRYDAERNSDAEIPMISFTDRQNALYFQYRGVTRRFAAGTAFSDALLVFRSGQEAGQAPGRVQPGRLSRITRGRLGGSV